MSHYNFRVMGCSGSPTKLWHLTCL